VRARNVWRSGYHRVNARVLVRKKAVLVTDLPDLPENLPDERIADISKRAVSDNAHRPLWREPLIWLVVVCLAGVASLAGFSIVHSNDQHHQDHKLLGAFSGALSSANAQIERLGGSTVAAPSSGAPGPSGPAGPGPSAQEVLAAVDLYCATRSGCVGTPTKAQVLTAVQGYCQVATHPCRGAVGATGEPGATGAPGAQGDQGPGPTDDQVATAVGLYCDAHGGCTGATGSTGPSGQPGRGITSIDCSGLTFDQLVIHYDDGTTETVNCTLPTPTVAPTS